MSNYSENKDITLDYSNVLVDNIGFDHGLDSTMLENKTRLKKIHDDLLINRTNDRMAFLDLPFDHNVVEDIQNYVTKNQNRFEFYVHLGIGGSALGPIALQSALRHQYYNLLSLDQRNGAPKMIFLDNIDPETTSELLDVIDVDKTLFCVVTKSGGTAETLSSFLYFFKQVKDKVGSDFSDHFVFVTDPEKGFLRDLANKENVPSFAVPPLVGGRFSIFTPVGLLPASIAGIDIEELLSGAAAMVNRCNESHLNPAFYFAMINYLYYLNEKKTVVMMPYSDRLYRIADWFRQLWAESLGKKYNNLKEIVEVGPLPIKALGTTDQHSQVQLYMEGPNDKIYIFLETENHTSTVSLVSPFSNSKDTKYLDGKTMNQLINAEKAATELALTENDRPNMTIKFPSIDPYSIGEILQCLEISTVVAGELFQINPFDQPGVEAGKVATYALMDKPGFEKEKNRIQQKLADKKCFTI